MSRPDRLAPGRGAASRIGFRHPVAFRVGVASLAAGVVLHLPDFFGSAEMGYEMAGTPFSGQMLLGMLLIVAGLALSAYGLIPGRPPAGDGASRAPSIHVVGGRFRGMDGSRMTRAHLGLLFVLGIALVVDVMKPATLAFAVPGAKAEYGLSSGRAAMLPLVALIGTTFGSVVWGMMGDRLGRRASILLATLVFLGTSICGFMPSWNWNLLMCFLMGVAAGGMLPIVYALMTEWVPAKHRGMIVVLVGGLGTVGGYLAASGAAAFLAPHFSWRILWFLGLPTGGLLLLLNRWIPESPRFLVARGRVAEAAGVLARFGLRIDDAPSGDAFTPAAAEPVQVAGMRPLFRSPFRSVTLALGLYGIAWGLVNWGFITFLPTMLERLDYDLQGSGALLFRSALVAVPATVVVAWLYGRWSSRKTMVLFALLTAVTLGAFATLGAGHGSGGALLPLLLVALLVGSGAVISMLSPYAAEVYPTEVRARAGGLAAGASKLGGILGPPLMVGLLALSPGLRIPALGVGIPMVAAAVGLGFAGVETRGRRLEEIDLRRPRRRSIATEHYEGAPEARPVGV